MNKVSLHEQLYGGHYAPSPIKTIIEYVIIFFAMFPMLLFVLLTFCELLA